jgi:hypothetical protein
MRRLGGRKHHEAGRHETAAHPAHVAMGHIIHARDHAQRRSEGPRREAQSPRYRATSRFCLSEATDNNYSRNYDSERRRFGPLACCVSHGRAISRVPALDSEGASAKGALSAGLQVLASRRRLRRRCDAEPSQSAWAPTMTRRKGEKLCAAARRAGWLAARIGSQKGCARSSAKTGTRPTLAPQSCPAFGAFRGALESRT